MEDLKWKWVDLMPGDILKLSEEFIESAKVLAPSGWWQDWADRNLKVISYSIDINDGRIYLKFDNTYSNFAIERNGVFLNASYGNIIVFDIVELVKD